MITRRKLEEGRHIGYCTYGYKKSFCELNDCCEDCDHVVRLWCRIIVWIEKIQTKRILKICK